MKQIMATATTIHYNKHSIMEGEEQSMSKLVHQVSHDNNDIINTTMNNYPNEEEEEEDEENNNIGLSLSPPVTLNSKSGFELATKLTNEIIGSAALAANPQQQQQQQCCDDGNVVSQNTTNGMMDNTNNKSIGA